MYRLVVLLIAVLMMSAYGQEEWEVTLEVDGGESLVFERIFGIADGATDGYDVLHDMPIFFGGEDPMVYFPEDVPVISGLSTDLRDNRLGRHTWNLVFQNMPAAAVSWEAESLPEEGAFELGIILPDSMPGEWQDMRLLSSAEVPAGEEILLRWTAPAGDDTIPPYVTAWSPSDGAAGVPRETDIYCEVRDDFSGVDEGTIDLIVDGINVGFLTSIDSIEGGYSVSYDPPLDFGWDANVEVVLNALDLADPSNRVSDTMRFTTISDSVFHRIDGYVQTGDPPDGVVGAIVTLTDFISIDLVDTTEDRGYFDFGNFNTLAATITASADGYDPSTVWLYVDSDTTVMISLSEAAPPEVLVIDYDSGLEPHYNEGESEYYGEEVVITDLLNSAGYRYELTEQNPDITSLPLDAFKFVVLITPARTDGSHEVISNAELNALINWLQNHNRMLWIAPDGGADYANGTAVGAEFYSLFGAVYESDGRAAEPSGNVGRIYGAGGDFFFDVDMEYMVNSPADNYIDEISAVDDSSKVVLESDEEPTPLEAPGRMVWNEREVRRTVLCTVLFGGMVDAFFPNTALNIMRNSMGFLEEQVAVDEQPIKPDKLELIAYPNPFNGAISIEIASGGMFHEAPVQLEIFDINGRLVGQSPITPLNEGGSYCFRTFSWSPDESTPTGIYLMRAKIGNQTVSKKVLYLK
ncbi:T9SS type A sorting domain-containing protein [bacterium]|nr:T9SS type A sorting domain-containing protein [bacterium]